MFEFSMAISKKPLDDETLKAFALKEETTVVAGVLLENPKTVSLGIKAGCRELLWELDSNLVFDESWRTSKIKQYGHFGSILKIFVSEYNPVSISITKLKEFVKFFFPTEVVDVYTEPFFENYNIIITVKAKKQFGISDSLPTKCKIFFNLLLGLMRRDEFCKYLNEFNPNDKITTKLSALLARTLRVYKHEMLKDEFKSFSEIEKVTSDFEFAILLIYLLAILNNISIYILYSPNSSGPITRLESGSFQEFWRILHFGLSTVNKKVSENLVVLTLKETLLASDELKIQMMWFFRKRGKGIEKDLLQKFFE